MTKELLTVEFRYHDKPKSEHDSEWKSKTITIGIYDTLEEAIDVGNHILGILSESFEVRSDDKFQKVFLFGTPKRLVTNCCYSTRGIQYFAKIDQLKFDHLKETVAGTFEAADRYKEYNNNLNNEES